MVAAVAAAEHAAAVQRGAGAGGVAPVEVTDGGGRTLGPGAVSRQRVGAVVSGTLTIFCVELQIFFVKVKIFFVVLQIFLFMYKYFLMNHKFTFIALILTVVLTETGGGLRLY